MSGADRFVYFLLFILLTIITIGIYPIYFAITMTKQRNELLLEICELLKD